MDLDPCTSDGTSIQKLCLTRMELFGIMKSSGLPKLEDQFNFLKSEIKLKLNCSEECENEVNKQINRFKSEFKTKWETAHRMEERFFNLNGVWLNNQIIFPCFHTEHDRRGRPEIPFEKCTERMKRQKTLELRKTTPLPQLVFATQMALKGSGQRDAANVLTTITSDPALASSYISAYKKTVQTPCVTGEEAVAMIVEASLSRHQYDIIRSKAPQVYPSYKTVQNSKKQCYPNRDKMIVSDTLVCIELQSMLDFTTKRLVAVQEEVILSLDKGQAKSMCLYSKWGFDGSSGHSSYKQAFCDPEADDASVFLTCFVPLRLETDSGVIIWQNPRPGSIRYCRPLKMEFVKESTAISIKEKERVDEEIKNLKETNLTIGCDDCPVIVKHHLLFSMIDGKVCNAVTETTSTQRCYICGATSKDFNSIDKVLMLPIKSQNLEFGISILHGWIRSFECLLHLAYKLPMKKWQAKGLDKEKVHETKTRIQAQFRERLGLIVDKPKPGFGNSNDGNTARRFFQNAEVSSDITKVDLNLIKKIHIVLIVVSCGHSVNVEKFREFALETARYFVEMYPWYYMPPTLHKFLIHGPELISSALLPIGQLTEEAQEARNKDFKKFREHHSRKSSRVKSNSDIFDRLILSSDPVIVNKMKLPKKRASALPKEAIDLLLAPNATPTEPRETARTEEDEDDDDDEEEENEIHADETDGEDGQFF